MAKDFKDNRTKIRKQFAHHHAVHENAKREFAGTAVMLDRAVNPLIRKYGIKVSFSSDVTIFSNDDAYLEMRLEMNGGILRKDVLAVARYIWELLSGYEYQKGGLYNIKYWEESITTEQRSEFHYHPERFPVRLSNMKMKISIV